MSDVNAFVFIRFFFGQNKGKADKFTCLLNLLDVLRESAILVPGWFIDCVDLIVDQG